jgi:hypothetical protein
VGTAKQAKGACLSGDAASCDRKFDFVELGDRGDASPRRRLAADELAETDAEIHKIKRYGIPVGARLSDENGSSHVVLIVSYIKIHVKAVRDLHQAHLLMCVCPSVVAALQLKEPHSDARDQFDEKTEDHHSVI